MDDEQLIGVLTKDALKRCFKKWGIEHTEEKINELCVVDSMKEVFLINYRELLRRDYA